MEIQVRFVRQRLLGRKEELVELLDVETGLIVELSKACRVSYCEKVREFEACFIINIL